MHAMLAMITANLKMTVRNRSALFWNLLFPALFIVIFGALLSNFDSVTIDVGLTGSSQVTNRPSLQPCRAIAPSM